MDGVELIFWCRHHSGASYQVDPNTKSDGQHVDVYGGFIVSIFKDWPSATQPSGIIFEVGNPKGWETPRARISSLTKGVRDYNYWSNCYNIPGKSFPFAPVKPESAYRFRLVASNIVSIQAFIIYSIWENKSLYIYIFSWIDYPCCCCCWPYGTNPPAWNPNCNSENDYMNCWDLFVISRGTDTMVKRKKCGTWTSNPSSSLKSWAGPDIRMQPEQQGERMMMIANQNQSAKSAAVPTRKESLSPSAGLVESDSFALLEGSGSNKSLS